MPSYLARAITEGTQTPHRVRVIPLSRRCQRDTTYPQLNGRLLKTKLAINMILDTMRTLGAELQRIRGEKTHLQQLGSEGGPAIQQELQRWERREAQVLNSIASEEALLEDMYEGYEQE